MHFGAFDDEPATVEIMDTYLQENGYKMICQEIDCIMKFIFQMQEKLLLKMENGYPASDKENVICRL